MKRQPGLFDMDERLRRLSDIGDQLEAFARVIEAEDGKFFDVAEASPAMSRRTRIVSPSTAGGDRRGAYYESCILALSATSSSDRKP